ncbi:MAG: transcription antitermination factor NusB [Pseudomonadota bacterium]
MSTVPRRSGRPLWLSRRDASARALAAEWVFDVCDAGYAMSAVLDEGPPGYVAQRDAALARAILRTTVRRRGDIDHVLSGLLAKPLPRRAAMARAVLRTGVAQLLFMRQPDHAAVGESVALMRRGGSTGGFAKLGNAVLRRVARDRAEILEKLPVAANTPGWLFRRWADAYGEDAAAEIAAIHREEPPLDLSLMPGTEPPEGAVPLPGGGARLKSAAVEGIEGYGEGHWWVQDFAAQLPATLLSAAPGMTVADLCAAPGGKTMQLAAAGAQVTAVEVDGTRAKRLMENLERTGLKENVALVEADARTVSGTFDAVLLDAPCSATGTLRRQGDVAWSKSEDDIKALATLQQELISHATGLLRPGGVLVFATCSLEPEEGDGHLSFIGEELPQLELDPVGEGIAAAFADEKGVIRTLPHQTICDEPPIKGLDGFFAARFRRV